MAFEGAQMVPVYDMNKSDGDGFMGGGAGWMWVVMLFFLLAWGGGFGGFGGGANGAVNTLTNEFLYTNLNNTIDRGFNQLANQNFGIQKDICESTGALQMGLCQGFNQTNAAIAESRFAAQQCCCETNRNIDAVRAENYKQYGIKCIGFNRWDLYFVMNMLYSDYYNVLGSDTATYVKMSKAWFEDPDVSEGKAYRYYMQVAKA